MKTIKKIPFTKMVASGNDFIVVEQKHAGALLNDRARLMCSRTYGIGADGLLVIGSSSVADVRMRVINADGSEAEMCGNGARCVARYIGTKRVSIETMAGVIESHVSAGSVKIKMTEPKSLALDIPIIVHNKRLIVHIINTGVPHAVVFVPDLTNIDVADAGKLIRYHSAFAPKGTNVNFVQEKSRAFISVRTYERGVEAETLACGTGSVASALVFSIKKNIAEKVNVLTRSGEVLSIYFKRRGETISDVWLQGQARAVFTGEFIVGQSGGTHV
jgi:diaminopimelate epimerase